MIHVVIPHYRCHHWLAAVLACLRGRQSRGAAVKYTVVSMDDHEKAKEETARICAGQAEILCHYAGEAVGGMALPAALELGTRHSTGEVTVTVDPDALVLRRNWDAELVRIFQDENVAAAGINPRSRASDFAGVPEWNWLAFRTQFWSDHIGGFACRRVDVGHLFKDAADAQGKQVYTWPHMRSPFPGKPASFVGDSPLFPWAFHAFYSSRKRKDYIPDAEQNGMLTTEQESEMIAYCTRGL